jgi:hypothetical protein
MATWVLGEFKDERALCEAGLRLRQRGRTKLDAYSPVPIHGVDEALGLKRSPVPLIALLGGVVGAGSGYLMQWWMNAVDYPINVGNRLLHSPPTNIPITFETGVLLASLSITIGLIALAGLPRLHHPVFELDAFRSASNDGMWLSVEVDPAQVSAVEGELAELGAAQVSHVAEEA